jgi:hypothetical protein
MHGDLVEEKRKAWKKMKYNIRVNGPTVKFP